MSNPGTTLVCPKCQGSMRAYERNGVTIDQCQECRGVFLDAGSWTGSSMPRRTGTPPRLPRRTGTTTARTVATTTTTGAALS